MFIFYIFQQIVIFFGDKMILKLRLLVLLFLVFAAPMAAQDAPVKKDSIKEKRDQMYKNIENYSKRKKFTKLIYKLIFRPVKEKEPAVTRKKTKKKAPEMKNTFDNYEGRIVRHIYIETLDPFGYSITDTTSRPSNWLENLGNRIHLKTKQLTIRNLLLIKRNKPLDSLLVKESERLIRAQRYVRRVIITPKGVGNSKDSVDVTIRVLDSWSLIPNGSASGSGTSIEVTERNFFGFGHEFRNDFDKRFATGETAYLARYRVPNIMNTYINAELNYQLEMTTSSLKSISFQRDFFSAYTKIAGGVYLDERLVRDSLPNAQNIYRLQNMKSDTQDYWAGYAFKIFKGRTEEDRTTNLVTTARYLNVAYSETPAFEYDTIRYFSSQNFYLASVGLTSRKFVQDKFLFNYDIVEDIPIGKVYSLTAGVQDKNNERRLYVGGRYAFGNYYKWGFLSINAQLGSFFYKDRTDQTTLSVEAMYFSNIKEWGRWRFRHFVKPVLVMGDKRLQTRQDLLNLNGEYGIPGFDNTLLTGTKKFMLTLQTQSYSPWDVLGFRISPFANVTLGVLSDQQRKLWESNIYSKIGLGVLLTNDYLIFNGFQFSVAYYPSIPGTGSNVFKNNTFKNNDLALPDFQVGKPTVVPYQ
jgi:hypothetical protein